MKNLRYLAILAIALLSCEYNDIESKLPFEGQKITGKWLLYEIGYSPGAGYVTKNVPAVPAHTVTFCEDGTLLSTIDDWKDNRFYQVLLDTSGGQKSTVLALFKVNPGFKLKSLNDVQVSYQLKFDDSNLKLYYRWCFEGCHIGLKKLNQTPD